MASLSPLALALMGQNPGDDDIVRARRNREAEQRVAKDMARRKRDSFANADAEIRSYEDNYDGPRLTSAAAKNDGYSFNPKFRAEVLANHGISPANYESYRNTQTRQAVVPVHPVDGQLQPKPVAATPNRPLKAAILGQRPVEDEADELDFGKESIEQQRQEEELARRKAAAVLAEETKQSELWKSLEDNAVAPQSEENVRQVPRVSGNTVSQIDPSAKMPVAAAAVRDPVPDTRRADARPTLMAAMMGAGGDPGLLNGPVHERRPRELNGYGQPLQAYTVKTPPPRTPGRADYKAMAENPYDNLDSTDPGEKALQDKLASMTLVHPEARDIPAKQRAKDEAALQVDLAAREKIGEDKAKYRTQSRQYAHSGAERNFRDRLLGRKEPSGKTRQDEMADSAMRDYDNSQKYADNRLGGIRQMERGTTRGNAAERRTAMEKGMEADFLRRNQAPTNSNLWAAMAGTAKGNLIRQAGAARMAGGPSQEQADADEFAARKERMAESRGDPTTEGGRMTARNLRQVSDEDKQARDSSPEGKAYLAKVSKQAGLSKPAVSLDEFKEQQRLNAQQVKQRGEQKSARNRAAMTAGQVGKELPSSETDPNVVRAHQVGMRKGPSLAQAMVFDRNRQEQKRTESLRGTKPEQLARLQAVLSQPSVDPKTRLQVQAQIDTLLKELEGSVVDNVAVLPSVGSRQSADALYAAIPEVLKRKEEDRKQSAPYVGRRPGQGGSMNTPAGQAWSGFGGMMPR